MLSKFIEDKLNNLRNEPEYENARVIFIAHSMGGLICRYYLECLEGWRNCKALITLGTPYQGSAMQLDYLVNGYKEFGLVDLTAPLRSFSSCYQLLPTCKTVKIGRERHYPKDANLPNLVQEQIANAWDFHVNEIDAKVKENRTSNKDFKPYTFIPIVGVNQPTLQSLQYENGIIKHRYDSAGDGTVPLKSAEPQKKEHEQVMSIHQVAIHGSMQSDPVVLFELFRQLSYIVSPFAPEKPRKGIEAEQPGLCLEVADLFLPGEPVTIRVKFLGEDEVANKPLLAKIKQIETGQSFDHQLPYVNDVWTLETELPTGTYQITVEDPVITKQQLVDLFVVMNK
jgi:hypothetical protein